MIIAIHGKRYSGKDYLASLIKQASPDQCSIAPLASMLKQDCAYVLDAPLSDFNGLSKEQYRKFVVDFAEKYNSVDGYHWCYLWLTRTAHLDTSVIVVPDIRHREQYDFFKERNALMVKVYSSDEDRAKRGWAYDSYIDGSPSETELDGETRWDVELCNGEGSRSQLIDFSLNVARDIMRWG